MKNRILTNSLRTIKTYFFRFLSLLVMSMLGLFAFAGLSSTAPDMVNTLDNYLKKYNTYDFKIISTMGLTQNDINELKKLGNIKVEGSFFKDVLVKLDDYNTLNIASAPSEVNKLDLLSGRLPKEKQEIVVEKRLLENTSLNIGDKIVIEDEVFDNSEFTIVGTIDSSMYFNNSETTQSRGKTSIGTGEINYYSYVLKENFNIDYYTSIYLSLNVDDVTGSDSYLKKLKQYEKSINKVKNIQEKSRYDEIYNKALDEVKENEKLANEKLSSAKSELESAKSHLDNFSNELNIVRIKLDESNEELINGKKALEETNSNLDNTRKNLETYKYNLDTAKFKLDESLNNLNEKKEELDANEQELIIFKNNLDEKEQELKKELEKNELTYDELDEKKEELAFNIQKLENDIQKLDSESEEYDSYLQTLNNLYIELSNVDELIGVKEKINYYKEEYEMNLYELNNSKDIYENSFNTYNDKLTEYQNNLRNYNYLNDLYDDILVKYDEGLSEYNNNLNTYNESYNAYKVNLNDYYSNLNTYNINLDNYYIEKTKTQNQIKDSYDKLEEIKMPKWYVYDRSDYSTYTEYMDDTNSISNLSKVFPILFFSVAILISLISMNRMVEDDRGEIGTLKSLGFSNIHILNKYLLFSFLSSLLGGIIGGLLGNIIIPSMIFKIYKILFELPNIKLDLNLKYILIGLIISLICICGTTFYTVIKVLKEKPSELIRPKAPKSGKRILLEKLWFWKNIKFSKKTTIRNIFRYKKRVLVTLFGIAGCTALIVCGFGIKDSIVDIASTQYGKIFTFDALTYVNGDIDLEIYDRKEIKNIVKIDSINAKVNDIEVTMFVSENNNELEKIVNLYDKNKKKVKLKKDKVIITEKLASLNNLKVKDKIKIVDTDNNFYEYEISDIVENHINHYIFMDADTLSSFNNSYKTNMIYINTNKLSLTEKSKLASSLLSNESVINILFTSDLTNSVLNMLNSLDQVVLILIILASLLSFVVLYNLSNTNINERKREIATLKVLGFYNKEVDDYITKENIILSVIGILIGLYLGYLLTNIIISTVEIEKARFLRGISLNSYIMSSVISIIFTVIVNIVTHFSLKKIDMIDSLKSVE